MTAIAAVTALGITAYTAASYALTAAIVRIERRHTNEEIH